MLELNQCHLNGDIGEEVVEDLVHFATARMFADDGLGGVGSRTNTTTPIKQASMSRGSKYPWDSNVVRCALCAVRCALLGVCFVGIYCALSAVRYPLSAVRCALSAVRCPLMTAVR